MRAHGSPFHGVRVLLVGASTLLGAACSDTERLGSAGVCFATADDGESEELGRSEARAGLRVVAPEDETTPPESFTTSAAGMATRAELIDGDGEHVWLSMFARYGARELVQPAHIQLIDGGDLRLELQLGFVRSTTLFLSNGAQPIVALQQDGRLEGENFGALGVDPGGATALPSPDSCGSATSFSLRFTDDDGESAANNGDTAELIVGGREFLGTNIHTLERGAGQCEDGPGEGVSATWVAADNSI